MQFVDGPPRAAVRSLTVTLVLGIPIAFGLTLSSLLSIWYADLPLIVAVQQMFHGINGFTLLALPFFFLAGSVMTIGGILRAAGRTRDGDGRPPARRARARQCRGRYVPLRHFRLEHARTPRRWAASSIPRWSSAATTSASLSASRACTSTMGVVIPPSILMVVYGATVGVSIGALLIGGILPGIIMGLALMVQSHIFAVKYDFPREHPKLLGFGATGQG